MLSFKSILVAVAAFASIVSAVPSPEVGNGLNIAQRSPQIGHLHFLKGVPINGGLLGTLPNIGGGGLSNLPIVGDGPLPVANGGASSEPVKRGGLSCKEVVQNGHNGIAELVIKIS